MNHPKVFADFHNADTHGRLRLNCIGTVEDLAQQQIVLQSGLPLTFDYKAHVTPRRQFVLVISGRVAVETTDGERREFGPGDFVLAEDTTGRGHLSMPLTADVRLMMGPLDEEEGQGVGSGSCGSKP